MNSNEERQQARKNTKAPCPTFKTLFRGVSVWQKIIRGSIVAPIMVLLGGILGMVIQKLPGQQPRPNPMLDQPKLYALCLVCCVGIGAAVGGALALKEVAESQWRDQPGPSPFMRALFGFGRWSLLLFWVPITIAITLYLVIAMPA